jgi:hypothetical protein
MDNLPVALFLRLLPAPVFSVGNQHSAKEGEPYLNTFRGTVRWVNRSR